MNRFKTAGSIFGVSLAVALGTTAVIAAPPVPAPAQSDLKSDVSQGEAAQANDQVGKDEAGQVAESEKDSATEADTNGPNDQVGDQAETGDKGGVDPGEKPGTPADKAGTAGSAEKGDVESGDKGASTAGQQGPEGDSETK